MKITKKLPLKPRGRTEDRKHTTRDAIREAYTNGPKLEVQIIPAKRDEQNGVVPSKKRVCAYCRVSTDEDSQGSSYELQVQNYTQMIKSNPDWEFAGIYADEGISGTSVLHREHFLEMIDACKEGKIDLIITKQVSRFARNVLDSLSYIRLLRSLDPPVGILFEAEGLNTLDSASEMTITVLSLVAQSESEQKSKSIKWAYKRRWSKGVGIHPNWALLGYELGEEQAWVINEYEAEVVRAIYSLYLDGYSSPQIAETLTKNQIPTVKGLTTWSPGSVLGILRNEKYCGDVLCQKTVTVDFFTHKSVKNSGHEPQYFIEGHHEPIIPKDDWLRAQQIRKERRYTKQRGNRKRKPKIVVKGSLAGFMIADTSWEPEFVDSIIVKLFETTTPPMDITEDENFIIEKE
ncbi:MAG: recombinase family protein [Clostridia bacterium]|nr:recombinase family protein [Clostridia bacterium]